MNERDPGWEHAKKILDNLVSRRFEKVFTDKEEFARFQRFLREEVIPAGNLLIAFPLREGGYAWFKYQVGLLGKKRGKLDVVISDPKIIFPRDGLDQSVPPECHGIPIWKLGG